MANKRNKGSSNVGNSLALPASGPLSRNPRSVVAPSRAALRVAAAQRVLAAELPSVIYQGRPDQPAPLSSPVSSPAKSLASRPERKPLRPVRPALDLKEPLPDAHCKRRPASSRGSGGSRPFVLWCKK